MTAEIITLAPPFAAGVGLGALYLAWLWLAVRRLRRTAHPVPWLIAGGALRVAAVVLALYLVMDGQWQRLAACLIGFVATRFAVTLWVRAGSGARPAGS